jgi:hypothetical protein
MSARQFSPLRRATGTLPSFTPSRSGLLQRKCACGDTPGPTGECEECRKKRLQRKAAQPSTLGSQPSEVPPIVHEVLASPGQPLDAATRAFFEPRFGHDFSQARVHTNDRAAESARAVNALAYTVGRDVVFGAGQFAPHSREGRKLIAHELTHVLQQQQRHVAADNLQIAPAHDALEDEGESMAIGLVANAAHIQGALASPALQRQPATPTTEEKKKPGEKTATSQPPPQTIPTDEAKKKDAKQAKPKGGEEKKGVEGAVSLGVETETKREEGKTTTGVAGKFSFEVTIPITDKLQLGPVSFLKEAGAEASAGLKSGESGPLTSLELETTAKVISLDFEKVKVPLGIADFGISGSTLAGAEYSPMESKGAVKFGVAAEAEAKFKRTEKSPFFITIKGGAEKTYDREGNAEFKWSPLAWKTSAAVGVEF